jgi:ABC-type lipoprotein export system ATPase subunit
VSLLCLESVSASFPRGVARVRVLKDVSLEVEVGELFAVYGKRAAGKTTLLEIAAGIVAPDRGSVVFGGHDLGELSRGELARVHREEIGWVGRGGPQTDHVPMRVHVAMPLLRTLSRSEAQDRADAMLERVGAADYGHLCWPDLPDTARVFVALAQALVREPKLLVVDDPIYGLGVLERDAVVKLLREVAEVAGVAVLLAAPELPTMLHAHRVRILANGKLIGPPPSEEDATVVRFPRTHRTA